MQPKLFLYCLNIAIRLTASTRPPRKRDDVSPKMWAMTIQVRENQVHGLPPVGCRTALGALSAERNGELFESGLDIVEFLDRRGELLPLSPLLRGATRFGAEVNVGVLEWFSFQLTRTHQETQGLVHAQMQEVLELGVGLACR